MSDFWSAYAAGLFSGAIPTMFGFFFSHHFQVIANRLRSDQDMIKSAINLLNCVICEQTSNNSTHIGGVDNPFSSDVLSHFILNAPNVLDNDKLLVEANDLKHRISILAKFGTVRACVFNGTEFTVSCVRDDYIPKFVNLAISELSELKTKLSEVEAKCDSFLYKLRRSLSKSRD